jgi:ABC-type lipoprotein export system ATPase subunit
MPSTAPLLQLKDVTRQFPAASETGMLTVLNGICLDVATGESLAIVGPSGSGKSTLLQIVGTLDRPTAGQVLLDGVDIAGLDGQAVAAVRNRMVGFVFQAHYLLPQCTVLENVLVPTLAKTANAGEVARFNSSKQSPDAAPGVSQSGLETTQEPPERRARRLLERVGLGARLSHFPRQLSGGESQRVAVVRALINSPRLLLADEPTGSLEHASALSLTQLLVQINKEEGVTLIVVTHSRELAKQMGRVLELQDGKWRQQ